MKLALIPAGTFVMGSPADEERRGDNEPQHEVEITRPFWLGVHPVTQAEYERVVGSNPSRFCASGGGEEYVRGQDTGRFPVECVSWEEAVDFCRRMSGLPEERKQGRLYRLPTEAEWEYSCRAGTSSRTPCEGAAADPSGERTKAVGSYPSNAWGLSDLFGNVWEWCFDWHDDDYYRRSPRQDPSGPSEGALRAARGGAWRFPAYFYRSAFRFRREPARRFNDQGFRVMLVLSGR